MADKDFNERDTISKLWCCPVLICQFHSFKRGIADLKISKTDSDTAKELFEKMCYSFSMDVYNDTYKDLKALGNTQIWNYFYKNWHPIRQDWVRCFKALHDGLKSIITSIRDYILINKIKTNQR
eukprot:TCONS_00029132-protein